MPREWTKEELSFLKENIGNYKVTTIAEKLNRSYESVILKLSRLGISNTKEQTGMITLGELANLLKVDRNTVKGWVERHGLRCTKRTTRKSKVFYFIDPVDFWEWAKQHKEKIQFSKIEPYSLPPEPDWVDQERKKDANLRKKRCYRPWTLKEDRLLVNMRKNGCTYKEISQALGRSVESVEKRFHRIMEAEEAK